MRHINRSVLAVLLGLFSTVPSHAATYTATPSTLASQLARMGLGDTVQLQPGSYPTIRTQTHWVPSGTSWADAPRIVGRPGVVVRGIGLYNVRYLIFSPLTIDCGWQTREGISISRGAASIRVQDSGVCRRCGCAVR